MDTTENESEQLPHMDFALRQSVTITDYLVRTELTPEQVLALGEYWPLIPAALRSSAFYYANSIPAVWRRYSMWVPSSLVEMSHEMDTLGHVVVKRRYHPTPSRERMSLPLVGFIVQRVSLHDGVQTTTYEEEAGFIHLQTSTGYRVAYNLNRLPLTVTPAMIRPNS